MGWIKELEKALKKWPKWFGIIFLPVSGVLYQVQNKQPTINIADFSGSLIIIFLMLAFYYSIPFVIAGYLLYLDTIPTRKKLDEIDLFIISVLSVTIYAIINIIDRKYPSDDGFWALYTATTIFIIIILIITKSLDSRKKKQINKESKSTKKELK